MVGPKRSIQSVHLANSLLLNTLAVKRQPHSQETYRLMLFDFMILLEFPVTFILNK